MRYNNLVSCHVGDELRDRFYALARKREMTAAALLRQLMANEVVETFQDRFEQRTQLLFVALAADRLLTALVDPGIRAQLLSDWQAQVAKASRHVD